MYNTELILTQLYLEDGAPNSAPVQALRARYPELAFIFDLLEDMPRAHREAIAELEADRRDLREDLERTLEALADGRPGPARLARTAKILTGLSKPGKQELITMYHELCALASWLDQEPQA